jgi:hypothetical protein
MRNWIEDRIKVEEKRVVKERNHRKNEGRG